MVISGFSKETKGRRIQSFLKEYGYAFGFPEKVRISSEQYFGNVPLKARELTIGGFLPAEKWLKNHWDRTLSMEDVDRDGEDYMLFSLRVDGRTRSESTVPMALFCISPSCFHGLKPAVTVSIVPHSTSARG